MEATVKMEDPNRLLSVHHQLKALLLVLRTACLQDRSLLIQHQPNQNLGLDQVPNLITVNIQAQHQPVIADLAQDQTTMSLQVLHQQLLDLEVDLETEMEMDLETEIMEMEVKMEMEMEVEVEVEVDLEMEMEVDLETEMDLEVNLVMERLQAHPPLLF